MENTQFHKHICSIIENHCYDYFEHDMEYIIERPRPCETI